MNEDDEVENPVTINVPPVLLVNVAVPLEYVPPVTLISVGRFKKVVAEIVFAETPLEKYDGPDTVPPEKLELGKLRYVVAEIVLADTPLEK